LWKNGFYSILSLLILNFSGKEVIWDIPRKEIEMAGKYTPLEHYLRDLPASQREVTMSFYQIERILNDRLPSSAHQYQAWWANQKKGTHVEAQAWLDAGWKVDTVNFNQKWVRFRREK
jgi:hypothetical protein